ncbi:MAG: hypothetical protein ABSG74_06260 [Candidatus Bathyarchaeia archaeon]|jgi:hypothetical protein
MEELQVRPHPSKVKRLLTLLLLTVIIAAAGIYAISSSPRWRGWPKQETAVETNLQGCAAVDVREFWSPMTIDAPTSWTCVDYAVRNITVTSTGSLTVVNSRLRDLVDAPAFLDNWGVLRIESSNIGVPPSPAGIYLRVEGGSITVQSSQMDSITVNGGSATIQGGQIRDEVLLNGGTSFIKEVSGFEPFPWFELSVSDAAQVSLSDDEIGKLTIRPATPSIVVRGFNTGLLTTPRIVYDFVSQWGMDQPLLRTTNMTVNGVELDIAAERSAQVSNSQLSSIIIDSGDAQVVDSKIEEELVLDGGLLRVEGSQSGLRLMGGNCTVSSSSISGLLIVSASQSDALTIDDFEDTRDAGSYDYASWGLTNLHVLITNSTVARVNVISEGGTVQVRSSTLHSIEGGRLNVSGSQIGGVSLDHDGFGEVVNSTWTVVTVDSGGVLLLLNTTSTTDEDTTIPYGTGRIVSADYVFVNTYDAVTRKPLNGVSIIATAATGNITSFTLNGSTRIILVDGVQTGATGVAHEHGTFTQYFPYKLTATRMGYLPASTLITEPWNTPTVDIYMYPANATSTLPPSRT